MQNEFEAARSKAEATYDSAAENFDAGSNAFWSRHGQATVDRLGLTPGTSVLDVGCGTGGSAIPAGEQVGPRGAVIATDLAENMLDQGRIRAAQRGLTNVHFRRGDMTCLGFPDMHFDAVVAVFAIFFVPDMERQAAELWRMVRPGGRLAITSWWGGSFLAPCVTPFWKAVESLRPDLKRAFNPWERIGEGAGLRQMLLDAGLPEPVIEEQADLQTLARPEDWWTVVLGSGLRWTVDQMSPSDAEALRKASVGWVRDHGIRAFDTSVIFAQVTKPQA